MNLVLLFILVNCGTLGAVVATANENIGTDELTEKIARLETENQEPRSREWVLMSMDLEEAVQKIFSAFQLSYQNKTCSEC